MAPPQVVDLDATIRQAALAHGLNPEHFAMVANCEDPNLIVDQQSNYLKDGKREQSYGIFQINIEQNEVSIASATDPVFAANWAAQQWNQGHANHWTCERILKSQGWS